MKTDKLPKESRILKYLLEGHQITKLGALKFFGCKNLPNIICSLRKQGFDIRRRTRNITGDNRFSIYYAGENN